MAKRPLKVARPPKAPKPAAGKPHGTREGPNHVSVLRGGGR